MKLRIEQELHELYAYDSFNPALSHENQAKGQKTKKLTQKMHNS